MEKIIVVGAGLSGATVARLFAENGKKVTVFDKRQTVGGNAFDYIDKNGIRVQSYGPHIFHTDIKEVFDFLSKFTEWEKYEHKVLANIYGKLAPVPFNLNSMKTIFGEEKAKVAEDILIKEIGVGKKVPILQLKQHENSVVREVANFVYKNIFYTYTMKQWGFKPEELGEEVMNRVPVYVSNDDRYFTDEYQFMPKEGFTEMVANMLRHPNITVKLGTDMKKDIDLKDGVVYLYNKPFNGTLIYTGCVDELFDYKYGVLPYRTLKFKFQTKRTPSYQQSAVVNYTTTARFTRISEFSKFTCEPKDKTVIVKEYSKKFKKGKNIPYYPIPIATNYEHYDMYKQEATKYKNLYLIGRLANYKYINMDVAVYNAMKLVEEING